MVNGDYQNDSPYFIGILPDGTKKWYATEGDWKEEVYEITGESIRDLLSE